MKQYDVRCPICGRDNKGLYLEETDGWMECEECHSIVLVPTKDMPKAVKSKVLKQFAC